MKRRSTWWYRLVALALALLGLEGATRLYLHAFAPVSLRQRFSVYEQLPETERRVLPHPYLAYVNSPGYQRGRLKHNALGWRGDETSLEKPEGVFRVLVPEVPRPTPRRWRTMPRVSRPSFRNT